MKQAIIYTRFSPRPDANDSMSCEFQERKGREYCDYRGLDVLEVYKDRGLSGKRADNRPGLQQALVQVCKVRGVLVVYDLARLARSTRDAILIAERLERRHADLAIVTQQIDTSTPMGRAFFKIAAVFGELQRETTAERTRAVLKAMQDQGFRVGRYAPYGFKINPKDPKRIIHNPDEVTVINVIVSCYRQNMGWTEIIRYLDNNGHKPREGSKRWMISTIKRIVEKYA
jgi:site-specific DNA recombinase